MQGRVMNPIRRLSPHCSLFIRSLSLGSNTNSIDYYRILNVERGATVDEIKNGFRAAAKRYHPDVQGGNAIVNEELFKKVNEAYSVLSEECALSLFLSWKTKERPDDALLAMCLPSFPSVFARPSTLTH